VLRLLRIYGVGGGDRAPTTSSKYDVTENQPLQAWSITSGLRCRFNNCPCAARIGFSGAGNQEVVTVKRKTLCRCARCVTALVMCVQCALLVANYDAPGKLSGKAGMILSSDTGQTIAAMTGTEISRPRPPRPGVTQLADTGVPRFTVEGWEPLQDT
jgi:hypothetical protein